MNAPTPRPIKTRRGFFTALLSLITAGFAPNTAEYNDTLKRGYRHGKHSGRNPGAFGGGIAAKPHRRLYVAQFSKTKTA